MLLLEALIALFLLAGMAWSVWKEGVTKFEAGFLGFWATLLIALPLVGALAFIIALLGARLIGSNAPAIFKMRPEDRGSQDSAHDYVRGDWPDELDDSDGGGADGE